MGAFEDFVNVELPLRTSISAVPTASRYPRFTGVGRAVEQRTAAQVLADIGAAAATHASTHQNGGGDEISVAGLSGLLADDQHVLDDEVKAIKLDDFATPDDNTDLDFSTVRHGLVPKGTNVGHFLKDDGTWAAGGGGGDTHPVVDTTELVKGSGDATKRMRIEVDGLTASTTRVLTMPDSDITPDDASASRTPSAHTIASHSDTSATGGELETLTDGSDADALHAHALADTHIAGANPHSGSADTDHDADHVTGGSDKIRDATAAQDGLATAAQITKLNTIEAGADATDAINVAAAGAVMDADFTAADEVMVGTGAGTHAQVTLAASQFLAKKAAGAATNITAAEAWVILSGQAGAAVDMNAQDVTNVGVIKAAELESTGGAAGFVIDVQHAASATVYIKNEGAGARGHLTVDGQVYGRYFKVGVDQKILDDNNQEYLTFAAADAAAVNNLHIAHATAGNAPGLSAVGADANIDLAITPKGTGEVLLGNTLLATTTEIRFRDATKWIRSSAANTIEINTNGTTSFAVAGTWEMALAGNQLTFNNGATDTSLRWNASGRLDIFVGAAVEVMFSANLMTFNNGAVDTGFGWPVSGKLNCLVGGNAEMVLEANSLTFSNGGVNTGFGWAVSGRLGIYVGGVEQLYFESGKFAMAAGGFFKADFVVLNNVVSSGYAGTYRFGNEVLAPSSGAPTWPVLPAGSWVAHGWHVVFDGTTKCIVPMLAAA